MKKITLSLTLVLALVATAFAQSTPQRVMTVDMNQIFNDYYELKDANAKFQTAVQAARDEVTLLRTQLEERQPEVEEIQARVNNPVISEAARSEAQSELQQLAAEIQQQQQELRATQMQMDNNLQQRRQEIINRYTKQIVDVIKMHAQDNNIDIVLNSSAPGVIYAGDSFDGTAMILGILNANAPAAN